MGKFDNKDAISVNYQMDTDTPHKCDRSAVGALSDNGVGNIKFQGVRAKHGEYVWVTVSNVSGAYFHISDISTVLVISSRR